MAINGIRPAKRAARTRKAGFSLEMHGAVGVTLQAMRNTLVTASVFMGNTYSKHAMWRLERPFRDLDRLRSRLDSCVFQEYPTLLHAARIYYPVDESVAPALPMTSLEGVCEYLAASAVALRHIADLLFEHYPVALGDLAGRISIALGYQAKELPYVVGPPEAATWRRPQRKDLTYVELCINS